MLPAPGPGSKTEPDSSGNGLASLLRGEHCGPQSPGGIPMARGGQHWVGAALSLTRPVLGGALRSLSCWVPTPTKAPALAGITSLSWEMWEGPGTERDWWGEQTLTLSRWAPGICIPPDPGKPTLRWDPPPPLPLGRETEDGKAAPPPISPSLPQVPSLARESEAGMGVWLPSPPHRLQRTSGTQLRRPEQDLDCGAS